MTQVTVAPDLAVVGVSGQGATTVTVEGQTANVDLRQVVTNIQIAGGISYAGAHVPDGSITVPKLATDVLAYFATPTQVTSAVAAETTRAQAAESSLAGTLSTVGSGLAQEVTDREAADASIIASLTSYVTNSALTTALSNYVTSSALTTTLGAYATTSALSAAIGTEATNRNAAIAAAIAAIPLVTTSVDGLMRHADKQKVDWLNISAANKITGDFQIDGTLLAALAVKVGGGQVAISESPAGAMQFTLPDLSTKIPIYASGLHLDANNVWESGSLNCQIMTASLALAFQYPAGSYVGFGNNKVLNLLSDWSFGWLPTTTGNCTDPATPSDALLSRVDTGAVSVSDRAGHSVGLSAVAPTSSASAGQAGQIAADASYIYRHDGTQWKRTPVVYTTF
jgi:hypothetical protein